MGVRRLIQRENPYVASRRADTSGRASNGSDPQRAAFFAEREVLNSDGSFPFGEGFRCVGGSIRRMGVSWAQGGVLRTTLDFGDPVSGVSDFQAGHTWNFQAWYRDTQGGGTGFNLSDGYMISFMP